jgi:hypothetical protein
MNKVFWLRKLVFLRAYLGMHEQDIIGLLCFMFGVLTATTLLFTIGMICNWVNGELFI